jgi:hypothetical protein
VSIRRAFRWLLLENIYLLEKTSHPVSLGQNVQGGKSEDVLAVTYSEPLQEVTVRACGGI